MLAGKRCYRRVVAALEEWRIMDNVDWAGVHYQPASGMLATFAKLQTGWIWATNPCRSREHHVHALSFSLTDMSYTLTHDDAPNARDKGPRIIVTGTFTSLWSQLDGVHACK